MGEKYINALIFNLHLWGCHRPKQKKNTQKRFEKEMPEGKVNAQADITTVFFFSKLRR